METETIILSSLCVFVMVSKIFINRMEDKLKKYEKEDAIDTEYQLLMVTKIGFFKRKLIWIRKFIHRYLYIN